MKIAGWNVTMLRNNYHIDILTHQFRHFKLDLFGVSETHTPRVRNMKLGDIEFICSGRKDGAHGGIHWVGLMMNKKAAKSL